MTSKRIGLLATSMIVSILGLALLAVSWFVTVLLFSFGDEGSCITAPYRVGDRPACVEVRP